MSNKATTIHNQLLLYSLVSVVSFGFTARCGAQRVELNKEAYLAPPKVVADSITAPWHKNTALSNLSPDGGKFLITKEGRNLIRQNAIKLVEHSEFRVKMDKKAAEKGMVRLSKKDAQAQAVKDYKEELYMKNVQSASEEYRKLKEELEDQNTKDDEYARELLSKAMW